MSEKEWKMHDVEERRKAVELLKTGLGWKAAARRLNLSKSTVKYWYLTWQAVGEEVLFQVANKKPKYYSIETKIGAAQAIVDKGKTYRETMKEFKIVSETPLRRWARAYAEGGEEALRAKKSKPKRTKKSQVKTEKEDISKREKQLLEENEYLRTEVEYLKKLRALIESE